MTPYLCDFAIDFDASTAYEASDVEELILRVQTALSVIDGGKVVVVLKNAHYLTTRAFSILYNYVRELHTDVVLVIVSSDKSRIFPPLLEYVQTLAVA
jgi:hypothetical protein